MTGETTIPESYGARAASLAAGALPWLAQRRTAAFARFQEVGFPSRRVEAWKYTDLARALRAQDFRPLAEAGMGSSTTRH